MFFRRRPALKTPFEARMQSLRAKNLAVRSLGGGREEIQGNGCAAIVEDPPAGTPAIVRLGVLVDGEIAALVDGGFQKFLETPGGTRLPALASQLAALHAFQAEVAGALGVESLYNQALGTVFDRHAYDRLSGRP